MTAREQWPSAMWEVSNVPNIVLWKDCPGGYWKVGLFGVEVSEHDSARSLAQRLENQSFDSRKDAFTALQAALLIHD